jgi:predicted RNA-binding Zn-ribbon protein involved in translation (DUF1610 family)
MATNKRSQSSSPDLWTSELQKQSYKLYDNIIEQTDKQCLTLKHITEGLLDKIYESEKQIQEYRNELNSYETELNKQLEQQRLLRKLKFQINKYIPVISLDNQACDSPENERRTYYRVVGDSDTNCTTTPSQEFNDNIDTDNNDKDNDNEQENGEHINSPAPSMYNCSDCGFTAKNRIGLSVHNRYCRVANSQNNLGKRKKTTYICPDCPGKTFKNGNSLKKHMRVHLH